MLNIGTFNCRGITSFSEKVNIVNDVAKHGLLICAIQETHIKDCDKFSVFCEYDRNFYNIHTISCDSNRRGIGFVVREDLNCEIVKISDRLAVAKIVYKDYGNIKILRIINVYAPPRTRSKEYKIEIEKLYQDLERNLITGSLFHTFICGDFNISLGQAHSNYPVNVGHYGKGKTSEYAWYLLDLLQRHDLYATNTNFQHKISHITTWQAEYTRKGRRNPIRTQIDYIIAHKNWKRNNTNARSYINTNVTSDHRLVVSNFHVNWKKLVSPNKTNKNICVDHLRNPGTKQQYYEQVHSKLSDLPNSINAKTVWKTLCNICITSSEDLKPDIKYNKPHDEDLRTLVDHQKAVRVIIQNCNDDSKKTALKRHRNRVKNDIRKKLKHIENTKILEQLEVIENTKNDSRRMFKAVQQLQRKETTNVHVKNNDGNVVNSPKQQMDIISEYFEGVFNPPGTPPLPEVTPQALTTPFTEEEITSAVKTLKNNKSAGIDQLKAEHLKYAPTKLHRIIAEILNHACETGEYPEELSTALLTPLQKPGKEKGPPKNLRPIMLLSTLRKILAICVIRRFSDRLFDEVIPQTQAAYRSGRSTTELIFSFRTLIEKAITSESYEVHLLMIDMSAAFDCIRRDVLINDLKTVLNNDELHLLSLLLNNIKIAIKLKNKIGDFFDSVIGSPQGDAASAVLFITYLARSKRKYPNYLFDVYNNIAFLLDQQYSDDCSMLCTDLGVLSDVKRETLCHLKQRNLKVNDSKTEEYTIKRNGSDQWKRCKLVGSLLDTSEDIKRRKQLANNAFCKLKVVLLSKKISTSVKLRVFKCYIESIFMYNAETWGLTSTQENEIDTFQRKLLRIILGIRWSANNWISNEELYNRTKQVRWSQTIRNRRLSFYGHVCRLDERTPARQALNEVLRPVKTPRGRAKNTYISTVKKDLRKCGINSLRDTLEIAKDRQRYHGMCMVKRNSP